MLWSSGEDHSSWKRTGFFISSKDEIKGNVMQQLRGALHPSWTSEYWFIDSLIWASIIIPICSNRDIEIGWGGIKQEELIVTKPQLCQALTAGWYHNSCTLNWLLLLVKIYAWIWQIPSVFNGDHLMVYALLEERAHTPQQATLIVHSPRQVSALHQSSAQSCICRRSFGPSVTHF